MTAVEIEHDTMDAAEEEDAIEPTVEAAVKPAAEPDWSTLKVKSLSKAQRQKLLDEYDAGVENEYFKLHRLKNGTMRITRRTNPLTGGASTEAKINEKYTGKRLTTEQLLLEHVLDLERKYEIMRQKHKKLKKRYNKLEDDIFDSDSDEPIEAESISRQLQDSYQEAVNERVREPAVQEPAAQESIITATFKKKPRANWRSMIRSM